LDNLVLIYFFFFFAPSNKATFIFSKVAGDLFQSRSNILGSCLITAGKFLET
jgi:hypothetical protein